MSGRADGGRDRYRKDYSSRYDEKSQSGHSNSSNPPSRHLWIGNLSHVVVERDINRCFSQFGELDSIAFQPSRSYAFINFRRDEDAIAAMRELQGFALAGNPLRIEFAKADKPSASSRDEAYSQHREDKYLGAKGSFSQGRHASPDEFYPEKSKMNDKNAEPSEVLWIGFPALLKVDEVILRRAFSPFGEIDKITTFPGRTYAFVRFRGVTSAWRAKETLQGKLFGNPRVHICFAKSDSGSSNSGRNTMNVPLSPRSPHLFSNFDSGEFDSRGFNRKSNLLTSGNNAFEMKRSGEFSSKLGPSEDRYEHYGSPTKERGLHLNNFPQRFSQPSPFYDDPWDLPEDTNVYPGSKKLKTGPFPQDKELPEYPISDLEQDKRIIPKLYPDFPRSEAFDHKMKSGPPLGYKQPDQPMTMPDLYGEKSEHWREPYDNFQGPDSLPSNAVARKRLSPDPEQSSIKEWKWEGTIAKGGTPVCRARCFPVGKVLDMLLPEFLDCTARTGLDMLSKHYYEAASAWVVFFVPESDSDIVFYNEFMNYLGEKQRAAVSKLDDRTTLFLVPPSEFSEKVLKVPGKLSISGVILRLERPGTSARPPPYQNETKDTNFLPLHSETSYTKLPPSPAVFTPIPPSLSDRSKSGINNASFPRNVATSASPVLFHGSSHVGNLSDPYVECRPDYPIQEQLNAMGPSSSSHHLQNSMVDFRNFQSQASNKDPVIQERPLFIPREIQETGYSNYAVGISSVTTQQETKPAASLATTLSSLPPDQLAQLASSLLGHQRQSGSTPNAALHEELRQRNQVNESVVQLARSQNGSFQNNLMNSEPQTSQFVQVPQMHHVQQHQMSNQMSNVPAGQREIQTTGALGNNQQVQNSDVGGESEPDPQKRLQATLQLAAALLQQIHQGKGS
ncbi:flowering time control protein FPA-like isoform X1 [Cucurbita pepo subsp. pepo]|uniref:flowering time control protein FPA-like isoform X1 n=1 Tax=Cucurbita pepo subsp. pepo TaxID=3664 RepID=UPI000C9D778E|nr:flowering time control protein FPA-like isoform X1 [Cucurbita pepo subsp. pepo]